MTTKTKVDKPATILRRAKRILKENGWYQGGFASDATGQDTKCPVCVWGALSIAAGGRPMSLGSNLNEEERIVFDKALESLGECVITFTNGEFSHAPTYNDRIAKSVDDIQKLLNCAIKRVENT